MYSAASSNVDNWTYKQKSKVNTYAGSNIRRGKAAGSIHSGMRQITGKIDVKKIFNQMLIWNKQQRLVGINLFSIWLCFPFLGISIKYFSLSFFLT